MRSYNQEISMTLLIDASCTDCYDANVHQFVMERDFGVVFDSVKSVDINSVEGGKLIEKYDIRYVPTVIFSSAIGKNEKIKEVWSQLGTLERGAYIFRSTVSMNNFGVYKDITTGEEILPTVALATIPNKESCASIYAFLSASCPICEEEKKILDELALNVTYVAAPIYTIDENGNIDISDIEKTMNSNWFSISWNDSQKILEEYADVFLGYSIKNEETGTILVPTSPFFVINCNQLRIKSLLSGEISGDYPSGTEKKDLEHLSFTSNVTENIYK